MSHNIKKNNDCQGVFFLLIDCVKTCPAVVEKGVSLRDAVNHSDEHLTEDCRLLKRRYLNCRRGQLDMRSRIRGNKSV